MVHNWLVIGISGVTCGGKTTLAAELNKIIPGSKLISQDDYFLDVTDTRHVWIKELNHINFDILTSLDMDKMIQDINDLIGEKHVKQAVKTTQTIAALNGDGCELIKSVPEKLCLEGINLLIIEGFSIFNCPEIVGICDIKYFFTLKRDECYRRRMGRVYEPPDCAGYFEACVWPEYLKVIEYVRKQLDSVVYFDEYSHNPVESVLNEINHFLK